MSDLKHRSVDDLRAIIRSCENKRAQHERSWKNKEVLIEQLRQEIAEHRKAYHNIGQREAWARIYLARKELEK